MVTPCVVDTAVVYRELQTCISAFERGAKADEIRGKMGALQLKIPADHSLGFLFEFAETTLAEMTHEIALEQLKNLSVLFACTYYTLPEPPTPCFALATSKLLTVPPTPSDISDHALELLREQVEKVKKEKEDVHIKCLVVIQSMQKNDAIIQSFTQAIGLSHDQLKKQQQMLSRTRQAITLVQMRLEEQDKLLATRKENLKTLIVKRASPFSLIDAADARCKAKLNEYLKQSRQISLKYISRTWSKWDPSQQPSPCSGVPKQALGANWYLTIEKRTDGIGFYLCMMNLQGSSFVADKEIEVEYQFSVKHRVTEKSILTSPTLRHTFKVNQSWGLKTCTTFTKIAADGGYTPTEDTITFLCRLGLVSGGMWGQGNALI